VASAAMKATTSSILLLLVIICTVCTSVALINIARLNHQQGEVTLFCGTDAFMACSIQGKGIGLVASRDIRIGEEVIRESPLLVLRNGFSSEMATAAALSLSDSDQTLYNELSDCYSMESSPKTAMGIFMTNALPLGSQGNMGGVFPRIARINHSCRPNMNYHYNSKTGAGSVHALRPILQGEELTQSYIPPCQPTADRQAFLFSSFNFKCTCSCCVADPKTKDESDRRRANIQMLSAEAKSLLRSSSSIITNGNDSSQQETQKRRASMILDNVNKRIALLEEDDLANPLQLMLCEYDAYQACKDQSDEDAAKWLSEALEHAVLAQGHQSPTSTLLKDLMSRL
jgi:hypothetical protein